MSSNTVKLHRVLRTTPEKIYKAFLDPDAFMKWLPPNGFTGKAQLDPQVGGSLRLTYTNFGTGKEFTLSGKYLELVPGQRIRYIRDSGDVQTTINLKKVSAGTELNITVEGMPVAQTEMCYLGWQESLIQLAKLVEPEIPG